MFIFVEFVIIVFIGKKIQLKSIKILTWKKSVILNYEKLRNIEFEKLN